MSLEEFRDVGYVVPKIQLIHVRVHHRLRPRIGVTPGYWMAGTSQLTPAWVPICELNETDSLSLHGREVGTGQTMGHARGPFRLVRRRSNLSRRAPLLSPLTSWLSDRGTPAVRLLRAEIRSSAVDTAILKRGAGINPGTHGQLIHCH